ncbi:MAG: hypothetical protein K2H31_02015, partial [Lachnospiraceae bacterium]|nr:hypothetical protein [Lachnospiraceae bacterium]
VADYPAAIMVNDTIYLLEGNPMPAEVDESAIIGYTESFTGTFPENNGETNFNPELGMPYAQVEGGIAVLYKNEWYLCTPFSIEHTTTFPGIIIDHTLESSVPVICVKTLDELAIPYEVVFFELPEGEEDWALKIGAEVLITCSGGWTEPEPPHFGTLISITEMGESDIDTDVLSPWYGVTTESEISEAEASGANVDATWDFSEIHGNEEGFIVSARDLYNDGGWGWFPCLKPGTYHFQVMGVKEDIYSLSATHNLVWKVYLMEEPFIDTPRFIPQAGYEAVVTGDGSVEIAEGTYIVIYCSQNSYEYGLSSSYEGDSEAFYQCTIE